MADQNVIRELMVIIECLRFVCEHACGETDHDNAMLTQGMSLGIYTNDKYKYLIEGYQTPPFWDEVFDVLGRENNRYNELHLKID